jgi:hypothetical protein
MGMLLILIIVMVDYGKIVVRKRRDLHGANSLVNA